MKAALFIDASVIVAILSREAGFEQLEQQLDVPGQSFYVSPLVRFEAVAAIARISLTAPAARAKITAADRARTLSIARELVQEFIDSIGAHEAVIDAVIGSGALDAWQSYGRGSGHRAKLNFGDCFAYATARACRAKLLYKGSDFMHTEC